MPIDATQAISEEQKQIAARQQKMFGASGKPLLGVAFSGGGIRSGTFNLGILQGMVKRGLLPHVDYLSTVSGGGYVGTWLHGVIKRYGGGDPALVTDLLDRPEGSPHHEPEHDPIAFLRKYSSYLAPNMGLFSADFWVIVGIWSRNVFLNQLILLPFLAALSLLMFFIGSASGAYVFSHESVDAEICATLGLLVALVAITGKGIGAIATDATERRQAEAGGREIPSRWDSNGVAITCATLTLLGSLGMALSSTALTNADWVGTRLHYVSMWFSPEWYWVIGATVIGLVLAVLFAVLQWQGAFTLCFRRRHDDRFPVFGFWGYPLLAGIPTGFLFFGLMKILAMLDLRPEGSWNMVAWGPPLLSMAVLTGASMHVGLMGVDYDDNAREWLARLGAFVFLLSFGWAALFTISVFGPWWITQAALVSWAPVAGLGTGWIVTSVAGALTGKSARTPAAPGEKSSGGFLGFISAVAPTVFIIGYLLLISFGVHIALAKLCGVQPAKAEAIMRQPVTLNITANASGANSVQVNAKNTSNALPPDFVIEIANKEAALLKFASFSDEMQMSLLLLLSAAVVVWYLPRRVDINEFSMHHFYKNRLVRCYLGATKGKARHPSRFTGFDPFDDIPLCHFIPEHGYFGPFPLLNSCVNLNRGSELAKRERRGSGFVFTPLYSGYDPPRSDDDRKAQSHLEFWRSGVLHEHGYRLTKGFGYPSGYGIGTCMAVSGAAANPNDGSHTSGPLAFLMTLFNVRLGWWVGNTRRDDPSARPGPRHSLMALLSELFAFTDAKSNFVNLSDGGHFENLGLYELVRRRCRYIIACDGEQDNDYTFDSLGGAIRKCRTDFGAEIDIDPRRIRRVDGLSRTHCVVGRITYPLLPGETEHQTGWLLYLKASLTGDEPEDVAQYKASHDLFPQEPTSNQFFTESQFESYRKLGRHVFETAFENVGEAAASGDLDAMFDSLYRNWYPPPDLPDGVASRHANAYSALIGKLSDPLLGRFRDQLISPDGNPDFVAEMPTIDEADKSRVLLYTLDAIQLMENVWSDLRMHERSSRDSPSNSGWITVFRHWVRQPMFQDAWKSASYTYNGLFQQFYKWLLK